MAGHKLWLKKERSWPTFSRKSAAIKYLLNCKRTGLQLFGHNSFGGLALQLFRFSASGLPPFWPPQNGAGSRQFKLKNYMHFRCSPASPASPAASVSTHPRLFGAA